MVAILLQKVYKNNQKYQNCAASYQPLFGMIGFRNDKPFKTKISFLNIKMATIIRTVPLSTVHLFCPLPNSVEILAPKNLYDRSKWLVAIAVTHSIAYERTFYFVIPKNKIILLVHPANKLPLFNSFRQWSYPIHLIERNVLAKREENLLVITATL